MRILYVGHTYTVAINQAKLRALATLPEVEILLLTPDRWKGPLYDNATDRVEDVEHLRHVVLPAKFIGKESLYFYIGSLGKILREFSPDVIHVEQGSYALSYAQVLRSAIRYAPNARATFFTWWNLPTPVTRIKRMIETFNFKHSACAIAGNADAMHILQRRGFHRPIEVIPQLGVDVETYLHAVPEPGFKHRHGLAPFVVGYLGRVTPEKGVQDLLQAMVHTRGTMSLLVVGNGELVEELQHSAIQNDTHVLHLPAVRNEEIPALLKQLDVLVLPSRATPEWAEQFGHILIEAMAARVPVIGAATGEIPNVIGSDGILVPPGDPEALRTALMQLRDDPANRDSLADRGLRRVRERYSHAQIAKRQKEVYEWMVTHGSRVGETS